jgi:hypothetical protein
MPIRVVKFKHKYRTIYTRIHVQTALPAELQVAEGRLLEEQQNAEMLSMFCGGT